MKAMTTTGFMGFPTSRRYWLPLLCALQLSACAVGPDYVEPQPPAPQHWQTPLAQGLSAQTADPARLNAWWRQLNDATLSALIDSAVSGNLDLQSAQSRVRQARAQRGVINADRYPALSAVAGASSTHTDANSSELYNAGLDASWELDLFGGKRRATEAASAEVQASEAELRDVLVTLLADVALAYLDVRVYQARLASAEASLANQLEALDLARWRAQAGLVTQLDVEQAQYAADQTRAQLPVLRSGLQQSLHRVAVLLGQTPGSVQQQLATAAPIPATPDSLLVGVPASALQQRPDVRQAERLLAAQTAQVGVATAALYPSLNLNGSIGVEALSAGDLFDSGSGISTLAGQLAQPLFNAGKLRRAVNVQEELLQQAHLAYRSTVLGALEETENALVSYVNEHQHRDALRSATESAARASELAQQQYQSGLVDFQTVLTTQRSWLLLQDELNQSNGEIVANTIRLYKALGGGWPARLSEAEPNAGAEQDE